jgi:hypothetical protein
MYSVVVSLALIHIWISITRDKTHITEYGGKSFANGPEVLGDHSKPCK